MVSEQAQHNFFHHQIMQKSKKRPKDLGIQLNNYDDNVSSNKYNKKPGSRGFEAEQKQKQKRKK